MKITQYGICSNEDCCHWGLAPKEFRENKEFLKCPKCKNLMYLTIFHPLTGGYSADKIVKPNIVLQ